MVGAILLLTPARDPAYGPASAGVLMPLMADAVADVTQTYQIF